MLNKCNFININNKIDLDVFQSKSDWCIIVYYFECFLVKKYKRRRTINVYLKDVKQYIDWYISNNVDKGFIINKEHFEKYQFYLQHVKKYKQSTIIHKKVALRKVNNFLIELNQQNSNEKLSDHFKTNRYQYNYLTKSYIKL